MPFTTKVLESHPANSYPFHNDHISCGARLKDAVAVDDRFYPELSDMYIMFGGKLAEGLYLVNAKTGERLQINYEMPS